MPSPMSKPYPCNICSRDISGTGSVDVGFESEKCGLLYVSILKNSSTEYRVAEIYCNAYTTLLEEETFDRPPDSR